MTKEADQINEHANRDGLYAGPCDVCGKPICGAYRIAVRYYEWTEKAHAECGEYEVRERTRAELLEAYPEKAAELKSYRAGDEPPVGYAKARQREWVEGREGC